MIRSCSILVCATLAAGALSCGSNATTDGDPLELVPLDNDVSGWTVDSSITKSGSARAKTASNEKQAVDMIDGGAAPFYRAPYAPKLFMWQNYANETLPEAPPPTTGSLMLYILQMPSAEQAKGLYTDLVNTPGTDYTRLEGTPNDWQPPSPALGTEGRIQDTGAQWWINFHKGVYYVEVMLFPSYGPKPDYQPSHPDLKNEALRFAQAIAAKM